MFVSEGSIDCNCGTIDIDDSPFLGLSVIETRRRHNNLLSYLPVHRILNSYDRAASIDCRFELSPSIVADLTVHGQETFMTTDDFVSEDR